MGLVDEREDARLDGDFRDAFNCSLAILNRKSSKRLMANEIGECIDDLSSLGMTHLLPDNFCYYSVYRQKDILNEIAAKL